MQTASVILMTNSTGTGTAVPWPGGKGVFSTHATFGGGSVAFQYLLPDSATWVTPTNGSLTADGGFVFELGPVPIRALATTATAVYASAVRIPE